MRFAAIVAVAEDSGEGLENFLSLWKDSDPAQQPGSATGRRRTPPFALFGHENETILPSNRSANTSPDAAVARTYFLRFLLGRAQARVRLRQLGSLFSDDWVKRRKA